jgi:histidinol-phosphatase (PHP family)
MPWTNYHSHTHFCDGSDLPEKYVTQAIKRGMPAYGFSSHASVNFKTDWCIPDANFYSYLKEIKHLKKKYQSEIEIYMGLEIDYIPGIAGRNKHILSECDLDFFIGSIHFIDTFADGTPWGIDTSKELFNKGFEEIFKSNFQKTSERFYELSCQMIEEDKPDIIGHLDKIKMYNKNANYFSESELWYKKQVGNLLRSIKKAGTIVEINTRGYYRYGQSDLYPSRWILKKIIEMDIPIMLNSDAHAPNEITLGFEYAAKELKEAGLRELWILLDNKWQTVNFNHNGLIIKP